MANVSSHQGLSPLPVEIWLAILNHVGDLADLASVARINQRLWDVTIPVLYSRAACSSPFEKHRVLFWGVVYELPRTLESALAAGINVDLTWHSVRRATEFQHLSDFLSPHVIHDEDTFEHSHHDWHWSAIHIAALKGNITVLEILLKENPRLDVGCLGLCGCEIQPQLLGPRTAGTCSLQTPMWTPLHVAICSGQARAAEMLLSRGASEDMEERQVATDLVPIGLTGLHVACMSGQTHMVEWFLNSGHQKSIDVLDSASQSPLVYAYLYQCWDSFQVMLNHGADINIVVTDDISAPGPPVLFEEEAAGPLYLEVESDEEGGFTSQTMLYSAIQDRRFEDACRLIRFGADLTATGDPDNCPLITLMCQSPWDKRSRFAWKCQQCDSRSQDLHGSILLDLLLESRLQFNKSFMGITALGYAARSANLIAVRRLLQAGADANGGEDGDVPPLLKALETPFQRPIHDIVSLLLDAGAILDYDTTVHEPALWSLYAHNEEHSDLNQLTELLLQHGATLARGTSTGDAKFTTPLEKVLAHGNVTVFETLLARCGQGALGEDDIVGLWRSVSHRSEAKLMKYILDMDNCEEILHKYDVIYLPIPRLSSQSPTPFDLILRLLAIRKGSTEGSKYLGGIINRAIVQNASPSLVKSLLGVGANYDRMYRFGTPLMEVLSKHGRPMDLRKEYIRVLLGAGDSIYRELNTFYSSGSRSDERPNTILGFAMNEMTRDRRVFKLIELMLELQPMREYRPFDMYFYIRKACIMGRMRLLMAIIGSSDVAVSTIRLNASELIHEILDTIPGKHKTFGDMNDVIDCLEFVAIQGGDCLDSSAPDVSNDTRTAKEKLLAHLWSNVACTSVMGATRWCFRKRMKFSAEDTIPEFIHSRKPRLPGVTLDDNTSLARIGRVLRG